MLFKYIFFTLFSKVNFVLNPSIRTKKVVILLAMIVLKEELQKKVALNVALVLLDNMLTKQRKLVYNVQLDIILEDQTVQAVHDVVHSVEKLVKLVPVLVLYVI